MVNWSDAEFHHVLPYADGGSIIVLNGALMEKNCHRTLKDEEVKDFADWWKNRGNHDA